MAKRKTGEHVVSVNRKARHDYTIGETFEAGLVLRGGEVKSLRAGRANLKDSYARINNGEAFLLNAHISDYKPAHHFNGDPTRTRKLLLHKREIMRLLGKTRQQGLTLVPLRLYFKGGRAKVELALAKGKRMYDKRAAIREREMKRDVERALHRRAG